jgi:hypothetical protein
MNQDEVTAVIVTRGNVDLEPVLESLIFDDVIVWDNSQSREDQMTYGRFCAAMVADTSVIYSQDDDIVHSHENQHAILDAYDESFLTGCMWEEWSAGAYRQGIPDGYSDLVFPGSGSISHRALWAEATLDYLAHHPKDDFFRMWSDTIIGVLAPTRQLDLRFESLPCSDEGGRMADMEDAVALKSEAITRARAIRDLVPA